jgi:lysophospholipid hydrolase
MGDISVVPPGLPAYEAASTGILSFSGVDYNLSTTSLFMSAKSTASPAKMDVQTSRPWIEVLGHAILFLVKVVPGILYWLITFATITLPSFLFSLFSTSLTFTMNATTL